MSTLKQDLQQALDALKTCGAESGDGTSGYSYFDEDAVYEAITTLEARLAGWTDEPVTERDDEIESLREQLRVSELQLEAQKQEWSKAYDIGVLVKHQLAASQAREAKLREALNEILTLPLENNDYYIIAGHALRPQPDGTALQEDRKQAKREAFSGGRYILLLP
jgi:hypothetical protein